MSYSEHPEDSTPVSGRTVVVNAEIFERLVVAIRKWHETHAKVHALQVSLGRLANGIVQSDEAAALALVDAMEALTESWYLVTAAAHEVSFFASSCHADDGRPKSSAH